MGMSRRRSCNVGASLSGLITTEKQVMTDQKNPLLAPLVIVAAFSVVAFSGIGVAAITGHLAIARASFNPFSSFTNTPASGMIQPPVVATDGLTTEGHKGLTRSRGETLIEGKPLTYRFGARLPTRKIKCPDCGVVDSIVPGHTKSSAAGIIRSSATEADGVTNIPPSGHAYDEQARSGTAAFVVTVHMENGTVRTIYESERPSFSIGERIKLVNGAVIRIG
jgi:hypothetical protein